MSTGENLPNATTETRPTTVDLLHDAYHAGLTLAQMAPLAGVTVDVSEKHGLTTTTEVQPPGTLKESYREQRLEKTLDGIAARTVERFRDVEEFADSFENGTFALDLAKSFDSIIDIHGENVHLRNPRTVDGREDGDIFIGKTVFAVEPGSTKLLNTVFNKLLHKKDITYQPEVSTEERTDGRASVVTIKNVSEHDIRAIGRAVDAVLAKHFRDQEGVRFPADKSSLSRWSEWGHTFPYPSETVSSMQRAAIKYTEVFATATYPDYEAYDLKPTQRDRGPLGTDASGIFQRWRNIINGLGHHLRGSSAHNLEQNPNPDDRISLEEGVELRRNPITKEQAEYGPGSPRTLNSVEVAAEALRRVIEEAKQNKVSAAFKAIKSALGFGLIDMALGAAAKLPKGFKRSKELAGYTAAYREQQRAAEADRKTLGNVVWYEVMGPRFRELDEQRRAR